MFQSLFAFVLLIPPFIHGIPYGIPDSDGTTIGTQQLDLPSLFPQEASTAQPLYVAANFDTSNIIPAPDTSDPYSSTTDISTPISSTTDIPNPIFPTTAESQPFDLSAGLNDPTYTFNAPQSPDNNGGVSTDNLNGGESTDTFEIAGAPDIRKPPDLAPEDKPRHNTPNCEGQMSRDQTHQRFLSCCNEDKTECVYFKLTHALCSLVRKWRGPLHQIQCCSNIPVDGQAGVECQNANNPFQVSIPALITPFGGTPEIKIKVNLPDLPAPEPAPALKIGPVEVPAGAGALR